MRGTLIGSRRTAIVLALGLALTGCTTGGDSAEPPPTPVLTAPSGTATDHEAAATEPSLATSATAISCLDGEWSFGPVQRQRIVSNVSEPLWITGGEPVQTPPLRSLRRIVATVEGNAPPELAYAQMRRLLPAELDLPPLGARPQARDSGFSYQFNDSGLLVFFELADLVSVDYRYTCQGRPDFGSITTWTGIVGGTVTCEDAPPPDPQDIAELTADVRAIACPAGTP